MKIKSNIKIKNKSSHEVTIKDIYKNVNISTILILMLFNNEIKSVYSKIESIKNVKYPITYLAYLYGMLNCYLDKSHKYIHMIFEYEKAMKDLNLTSSSYFNFIDMLIDSDYFHSIQVYQNIDVMRVCLKIPEKYHKDIDLIVNTSKFSDTSDEFKKAVNVAQPTVPVINNEIAKFLIVKNLAMAIVVKSKVLKTEISKTLGIEMDLLDENMELYNLFDKDREYWDESKLQKYSKNIDNVENNFEG